MSWVTRPQDIITIINFNSSRGFSCDFALHGFTMAHKESLRSASHHACLVYNGVLIPLKLMDRGHRTANPLPDDICHVLLGK